jgi:signal transduction histidine kinase/ActR/RegA family two-component response regulator
MNEGRGEGLAAPLPSLLTHIGPVIPLSATVTRYAAAAGVVLFIFTIRAAMSPLLGVQAPLLPFLLGVLLSAYLGGRGPALLASGITPILATIWFTSWPQDGPPQQWLLHVAFFLVLAVLTILIMEAMQITVRRANENARRAEQSAQALREADQRKDEFLAMLAHELRNPLTPVRNVAHILARTPDAATVRRAGEMLARQAGHLTHLVDDLLDVARITHRRIQLKFGNASMEDLVNMALDTVHPLLAERHQRVTVAVSVPNVHVNGDMVRLCQVLSNLLTNASKYSPEGRRIHVSVGADAREVLLKVRDEGYGIDRELLPRLFDLFMQGDRSLDRAQGGLGIGLTIVKHLVEMHGGSVEAVSEGLGKGSEFRVRLPRAADVPLADAAQKRGPQRRPRRRRVLVVDDNFDCADSLRDVLRLDGHDVAVVHDGPAALTRLEDFAAEVVLLDVGLPRIDGYMVAHAIRARYPIGRARPRLVALTGYGRDEDRQAALRSGFDEHLTKPLDPEKLLRVVAEGSQTQPARESAR